MRMTHVPRLTALALALALPTSLFADFSYQETTQITGGSILSMIKMAGAFSSSARKAGAPITTSIFLKGNQLARVSADSIEVIDLDKEAITHIDTAKHTYTIITFQQMRDQIAKAQQEAAKNHAASPAPEPAAKPEANDVKMSFDVKVRQTGMAKDVSGLPANEAIMTMMMNATATSTDKKSQQTGSMAVTNDMWLVPDIPGYNEIRIFYIRMATKMGTVPTSAGMDLTKLLAQNPGATEAMAGMAKEMQKIQGVPVMQVMRMGTTTDGKPLPAASEAPLPADNTPAMPSGGEIAKQGAASMLTSHFGLGGFGRKKQQDPAPASGQDAKTPTSAVLMESQSTSSNFSTAPVDPTHFEVPAGYKQVQR